MISGVLITLLITIPTLVSSCQITVIFYMYVTWLPPAQRCWIGLGLNPSLDKFSGNADDVFDHLVPDCGLPQEVK